MICRVFNASLFSALFISASSPAFAEASLAASSGIPASVRMSAPIPGKGPVSSSTQSAPEATAAETAEQKQAPSEDSSEIDDPMEEWNRSVLSFNRLMRDILIHPIAVFYEALVPECIQKGIRNVISNLSQPFSVINSILQFDGEKTQMHLTKLLINTTFGLCGWTDVSGLLGLSPEEETFGDTLKQAGLGPGPFMMLPILGPSHLRNSLGIMTDFFLSVPGYSALYSTAQSGMQSLIDYCDYKEPWRLIEEKFDDPYIAIRQAYYESQGDLKADDVDIDFDDEDEEKPSVDGQKSNPEPNKTAAEKNPDTDPDSHAIIEKKETTESTEKETSTKPSEDKKDEDLFPGIDDMDLI